jgi:GWxTD domain-containing protein
MSKAGFKIMSLGFLAAIVLSSSCKLYNLEQKLSPANADFLSKVRYIVTREERKIFLELPDSEKPKFIEEFWKRRDPDPDTEENEFKIEYFNRIELATKQFASEGIPGWLTDRGRIYILFGPPTDKITQPMGGDPSTRCGEIWYYGNFPVIFSDPTCTGSYKLVTYDLSGLRDINLMYMHELNLAQGEAQKTFKEEKRLFDFNASLRLTAQDGQKIEGVLNLNVPYGRIWFKSEGKKMTTALEVSLELRDSKKELVWDHKSAHNVVLDESELAEKGGESFVIEIPLLIVGSQKADQISQGKSLLYVTLTNKTGNEVLTKALEFK